MEICLPYSEAFGRQGSVPGANCSIRDSCPWELGDSYCSAHCTLSSNAWLCIFKAIIAELKFETVILITNYSNNFEIGLNWLVMLHLPESFYGKVRNKKKKFLGCLICLVLLNGLVCNRQVLLVSVSPDPYLLQGDLTGSVLL